MALVVPVAPRIVTAIPQIAPGDGPARSPLAWRVTFSPDGDGRNDRVVVRLASTPRAPLLVRITRTAQTTTLVETQRVVTDRHGGATISWDGRTGGGASLIDGSYRMTICASVAQRCATRTATTVVVHLRRLEVAVMSDSSFPPGATAPIWVGSDKPRVCLAIVAGPAPSAAGDETCHAPGWLRISIPALLPGVWRLRATDTAGNVRLAPLVVRSRVALDTPAPGTVLVVEPYLTWRAYNEYDADRDGAPDSWYADWASRRVSLFGPFEGWVGAGSEYQYSRQPTLTGWVYADPSRIATMQVVTDAQLATLSTTALARYRALVFDGHEEYYPTALYDAVLRYRNHGGRLAFLSANNFFRQVRVDGTWLELTRAVARDARRSDFAIAGDGFSACCWIGRVRYAPLLRLRSASLRAASWLFAGTGLRAGNPVRLLVGSEVDATNRRLTPRWFTPLATGTIRFRRGGAFAVVMGYGVVPGGGEVFAAGSTSFVDSLSARSPAWRAQSRILMTNLWQHLAAA